MNFATVAKITQYPSVHQPNNYASFNQPNNYYSISQPYNYTTFIPFETNYSVSQPINASIPQKINNYSFPHYTNCDSIYQNSQSIIKDLLLAQPKENNALIQHTDYHFQNSTEQDQMINEQLMAKNSEISNEGLISQDHYQSGNYEPISQNQIQINNYESLYQFQDNTNVEQRPLIENQMNYNQSQISILNEGNENNTLNELGINEENSYSFNIMDNKVISISNRLDEHKIKQENLNEWFRKAIDELKGFNKEQKEFNKEQKELNKELKELNKKQEDLNQQIFNWMKNLYPWANY